MLKIYTIRVRTSTNPRCCVRNTIIVIENVYAGLNISHRTSRQSQCLLKKGTEDLLGVDAPVFSETRVPP